MHVQPPQNTWEEELLQSVCVHKHRLAVTQSWQGKCRQACTLIGEMHTTNDQFDL